MRLSGSPPQNHQLCGLPYQVHPRIRGEYQYLDAFGITSPGSPPLSRGIQVLSHLAILSHRFTPAFAGNTSLEQDSRLEPKVHPRLRGEKIERKLLHLRVAATHPRLRGEDFTRDWRNVTTYFNMLTTVFASHKIRSRREILPVFTIIFARNIFNARFTFSQLISSTPLSRGRSRDLDLLGGAGRFTPAYAGNTRRPRRATPER